MPIEIPHLMLFDTKNTSFVLLCSFLLATIFAFGQTPTSSYKKLWNVIDNDHTTTDQKLHYLDLYLQKAQKENNLLEEYQALKEKTYILPFNEAVMILHRMAPVVQELKNDSIRGNFYNRSTTLYYKNRYFNEALDYAIASEAFNEKTGNLYNLNAARIDIGNIYYHTRYYQKAETYFLQAKDYYQSKKGYNHIQWYISSLYSLGKTYTAQENIVALQNVIKESENALPKLKPEDRAFETAYLDYVKGGRAFLQQDYTAAQNYFKNALPAIQQNGDFANEHVIYLYLGKILWQQNQKEQAVAYFTKIDQLFRDKKFLNYELRDTYDYLIAYYKETNQTEALLQVEENLNLLNQQFEREQKSITDHLHNDLETKKMETEHSQLQKTLNNSKSTYRLWLIVAGVVLLLLTVYVYRKNQSEQRLKEKFNAMLDGLEVEKQKNVVSSSETTSQTTIAPEPKTETPLQPEIAEQNPNISAQQVTEQRILKALEKFEQEKGFLGLVEEKDGTLRALKLEDLALKLGTNRTSLSNYLNTHKGGFALYLTQIRLKQIKVDLKENKELRKKSVQELSEIYGFASLRSFNTQFKEQTGLTPSYFIKELELRDLKPKDEEA